MIDCSVSPYDLSVPVNIILQDIKDARAQTDAPLVVLCGERHTIAPSVLLSEALTKALWLEGVNAQLAIEYSCTIGDDVAAAYSYQPPKFSSGLLNVNDVLKGIVGLETVQHVTHIKAQFCLNHGLVPCFSDAAKGILDSLDVNHRLTRAFVKAAEAKPSRGNLIFSNESAGMKTRNMQMYALGARHLQKTGADILVHAVGGDHVLGVERYHPYEESMQFLYKQAGFHVLSYLNERDENHPVPVDAPLDGVRFIRGYDDMPKLGARSNAERMEIYRIANASKGLIDFADVTKEQRDESKEAFIAHITKKGYRPKI
jgi:hypothetical protein